MALVVKQIHGKVFGCPVQGTHSYKLNFHCTNNIAEYEALLLGLKLLKKLGAKSIVVHGDSKLIIKQIKGEYVANHPRLRNYKNVVLDFLRTFEEYDLSIIPSNQNILANGLAFLDSTCQMPHPNKQYTMEVKHRPVVLDNMRHWQVFGRGKQIDFYKEEYENNSIDSDCEVEDHIISYSDCEVENMNE